MASQGRSRSRLRYTFDGVNRLVIRDPADALRPVRILEGRTRLDPKNRLSYHVESTAARDGHPGLRRVNLDGTWGLTRDHGLKLRLRQTARRNRQTVYLKGEIVQVKAHALIVSLRRHTRGGRTTVQRLSLSGRWQADRKNRLTFLVQKADGAEDRLTFQGAWKLGKRHELEYRYREHDRPQTSRRAHRIVWTGAWDMTQATRLVYRLQGSSDSAFEFRASLQSPSLRASEGRIVYQVGIGVSGGRRVVRQVVLFGRWKVHRDLSISFEIPYREGRRQAMRFDGTYAFTKDQAVVARLLDRRGRPLGLSVTFTRKVLGDTTMFLRLRQAGEEAEAFAGVQMRF